MQKHRGWLMIGWMSLSLLWACQSEMADAPEPVGAVQGKPHLVATPSDGGVKLNWGWLTWGSGYRADQEWQEPEGFILLHSDRELADLRAVAHVSGSATSYVLDGLPENELQYFALQAYWQTGDTFTSNRVAVMPGQEAEVQALFPGADESRYWGSWSPQGRRIAYVRAASGSATEGVGVYVYDQSSREETLWRGGAQPDWAPAGDQVVAITDLAFNRNHPDSSSYLTLMTPGSSTLVHGGRQHLMHPAWSPDGRWWLYLGRTPGQAAYTLYRMPVGGSYEPRPLALDLAGLSALPSAAERSPGHPRWHPSEGAVVYHRFSPKSYLGQQVFAQDIFLLSITTGVELPLITSPWNDTRPVYAPDGRHLAFVSDRSGQPGLWVYAVESQRLWQVYGGSEPRLDDRRGRLDWSPDGQQLLFNAWVSDTTTSLFTLEMEF